MSTIYRQMAQGFLLSTAICMSSAAAFAQEQQYRFDLPAQNLGTSLRTVTARAGWQLFSAADDINNATAPELRGTFTIREAVELLLAGTGLTARVEGDAVVVKRTGQTPAVDERESEKSLITVTGTRIRGAPPVVPATVISSDQIKMSGHADLGEVARALPQSFGGGQNPGIGNTQGVANENANANGASTFNLRGIGPNATLTLINGNRFGHTGVSAAIDVTAIPVAAVERIEIVADGSSAIYGADAVGGVVNIILKQGFSGVSARARVGASTDGGNEQQQYSLLAGTKWASGNIMAAYDFSRNSSINAGDRDYADSSNSETDIYPAIDRHAFLLSGRQDVGANVTLGVDAIFKTGVIRTETGFSLDRPIHFQGFQARTEFESLGISPTVDVDMGGSWSARVSGFYGTDRTDGLTRIFDGGAQVAEAIRQFDNQNHAIEAGLEGNLFELPAGPVRIAMGGGFRSYSFSARFSDSYFKKRRNNYFAYGEAYVPLLDRGAEFPFLQSAALTGALRFEDYSDSGQIVVPKLGLTIEPLTNIRLGLSWGRSFKLPSLVQQYSGYAALLVGVSGYGTTFPAGSNYLLVFGPDPNVSAERSENWTVNAALTPLDGLEIGASYFNIDYRDRVAPPLASSAGALTNPIYAQFVTFNPTPAQQTAIISPALGGLQNITPGAYDPANVIAILDARDRNIARQRYKGVDLLVQYTIAIAEGQKLGLSANVTWLDSKQQLLPGLPVTQLAGTIFQPPKFRARGGVTFDAGSFSAAAFANHSSGVSDNRRAATVDIGALTTVDLTGRFAVSEQFEITFNALNIFNAKPDRIFTTSPFDTPFDTTNYSAAGRFFGVTASGKW